MVRLALAVFFLVSPLLAAGDADLVRLLKGIEQRYNTAKSLQVQFNESYSVQGRPRQSESGTLTLRKPGRMRWDYSTPSGKLFLSDGKNLYLYTPQNRRVERTKLKDSDDMRGPLAFLLGKLDFSREFRDFAWKPDGANYLLDARAQNDRLPYDKVEMLVTPQYEIRKLVVTNQDQSVLTFLFDGEKINPPVNETMFRFHMPEGAAFAGPEGAQAVGLAPLENSKNEPRGTRFCASYLGAD